MGRTVVRRISGDNKQQVETALNNLLSTVGSGITNADLSPNAQITLDKLKAVVIKGFTFSKQNYKTAVPHRLGVVPKFCCLIPVIPTATVLTTTIQQCAEPDAMNVYLSCSAAGRKCNILIVG